MALLFLLGAVILCSAQDVDPAIEVLIENFELMANETKSQGSFRLLTQIYNLKHGTNVEMKTLHPYALQYFNDDASRAAHERYRRAEECVSTCPNATAGTVGMLGNATSSMKFSYSTSGTCRSMTISCYGSLFAQIAFTRVDGSDEPTIDASFAKKGQVILLEVTIPCESGGWGVVNSSLAAKDNIFTCDVQKEVSESAVNYLTLQQAAAAAKTSTTTSSLVASMLLADSAQEVGSTSNSNDTCCPSGGVWSEWSTTSQCIATCGSCAQQTYTRTCLTDEETCPCSGDTSKVRACNTNVCLWALNACCGNFTQETVNDKQICGPQPTEEEETSSLTSSCCSTGVWGAWGEWGACSGTTCGVCGGNMTRTRDCYSSTYGCECEGNSTETISCKKTGTWSEWAEKESCHATDCGGCQHRELVRECTTDSCDCVGESLKYEPCNTMPCDLTKSSGKCCPGFYLDYSGSTAYCAANSTNVTVVPDITCQTSCCPSGGIWSEWSTTAACSDTCGSCGLETRERTCLSDSFDCPCTGNTTESVVCATNVCLFRRESCCSPYTKMLNMTTQSFYCGPLKNTTTETTITASGCCPDAGLWNSWQDWSSCSSLCGLCGTRTRQRTCASKPHGCDCSGESEESYYCGDQACLNNEEGYNCCSYATLVNSTEPYCVMTNGTSTLAYTSTTLSEVDPTDLSVDY